jgi:hypothetical protein
MLKKTIKYKDYDGNEREEDFYFNLTKAEITMMEAEEAGGLVKTLMNIMETQDSKRMISYFKDIILRAYGVKSPDGRKFIKNDQVREDFEYTEAFSQLFMELAFDAEAASMFVNGIIPDMPEGVEGVDHNASPQELQKRLKELEATNRASKE